VIGEARHPPDDRTGDAEHHRVEAWRRAEIAHEGGQQIRERRERGGGISEEVDGCGSRLRTLEHAEQCLGAAHVARQNHLGWIIVNAA